MNPSTLQSTADAVADVNWAQILNILQDSRRARPGASPYPSYNAYDMEEAVLEDPSSSTTETSPSRPASPAGHPPAPSSPTQPQSHHLQHHPYFQPQQPQPQLHAGLSDSSHSRGMLLLSQLSRRTQAAMAPAATAVAGSGADAAEGDTASVSASAERHRLISESTGVNLQVLAEWVSELVPFVLLLAWVFVVQHYGTLFLIMFLAAATFHANSDIRRLIAMRREARVATCLAQALTVLGFSVAAVVLTLPDSRLMRVLSLRMVGARNAVDTVLLVLLADSVVRFASLAPKLGVVAWFRSRQAIASSSVGGAGGHLTGARQQRQQSRVLTAVERGVALYRTLLPGPVWYGYLLHGEGFSPVLASLFCGFYLVLKVSYVAAQARLLVLALRTATRQGALYGTYVGRSDGVEAGGTFGACPVCQDPVNTPVRLECGHIFCEECILEWLERDRTCPMCRAQVRPAGLPSCSDGASPLLPQVF